MILMHIDYIIIDENIRHVDKYTGTESILCFKTVLHFISYVSLNGIICFELLYYNNLGFFPELVLVQNIT